MAEGSMPYDRTIADSYELSFEPTFAAASNVRRELRRRLDAADLPPAIVADMELVVSELTSNAVAQHPPAPVKLDVALTAGVIRLTVANRSTSDRSLVINTDNKPGPEPEVLADSGRGLSIVEALTDEMWVENNDGWTSVTCLRRFDPHG